MTEPAKDGAWASRYLDLWERHLAAENDRPTAQKIAKSKATELRSDETPEAAQ